MFACLQHKTYPFELTNPATIPKARLRDGARRGGLLTSVRI